jgi:hypothetical protein
VETRLTGYKYFEIERDFFNKLGVLIDGDFKFGVLLLVFVRFLGGDNIHLVLVHCRQRAPVGIVLSSSGTSQLGMFDIQATTNSKFYDHIVLLYLESRRCRYRSIIFVCFYLYVSVVNLRLVPEDDRTIPTGAL